MGTMPSGTVTLLFSDIEGSTLLLRKLGPDYAGALGAHRRILRAAWTGHRGAEQGTEGDSFFVVFETAADAVSAAVQGQRELAGYPWQAGEVLRVRMGIHTGAPRAGDDGYVGMDVHRGARIAAAAHGGQIVVSDATAHLLASGLPEGVTLRDLGLHRLKDLPEPERLYQVEAEGLPAAFPPLRSLGAATRLPAPGAPLVGREVELAGLGDLVASGLARLVTLTGAGGSGKTRLAIEVARHSVQDFSGGVHFIALMEAQTAEEMWDAMATTLGVPPGSAGVLARLGTLRALLVVDNLEQVTGADGVVRQILRETDQVVLVATSRRPLHVPGEQEFPVSPLAVPSEDNLAAAQGSPAVELFVQQARLVRPGFALTPDNVADVVDLCRRLDGLPLAIEIAGARIKVLSPHALLARLNTGLDMASAVWDIADRQRTVRATIAWSYDLLTPELQTAFARLGVFEGGADLPAVSAVLGIALDPTAHDQIGADPLEVVTPLVDASLVTITESHDGEPRVVLLETLRAFAVDRLSADGALDTVRASHAEHYLRVVEALAPQLAALSWQARQELDQEQGNLRAALRWCLESGPGSEDNQARSMLALRLCAALCDYWDEGTKFIEARRWLELVVNTAGPARNAELGRCLRLLAKCLNFAGDHDAARRRAREAIEVFRQLGDLKWQSISLMPLAFAVWWTSGADAARPILWEAVEVGREANMPIPALSMLAILERFEDNNERALELHEEMIALEQAAGDQDGERFSQLARAGDLRLMGRLNEARDVYLRYIPAVLRDRVPEEILAVAESYAAVLADFGRHADAAKLLGAADAMRERTGYPYNPAEQVWMPVVVAAAKKGLSQQDWDAQYQIGRTSTIASLLSAEVYNQG